MEVVGEVGLVESQKACATLSKHLYGLRRFMIWYMMPFYLAALALGDWLFSQLNAGLGIVGLVLVAIGGFYAWMTYCRRMVPAAWARRGVPLEMKTTYRTEAEGLVINGPLMEVRLAWNGLSQIAPGNEAWLFIGPGIAYFLPTRLFSDKAAERTFLADCLRRMTPDAQALSREAAALVASGPSAGEPRATGIRRN